MSEDRYTTMSVKMSTKEKLEKLKLYENETFDEIINRIANNALKEREEKNIVRFSREKVDFDINTAIVDAIELSKPPSKFSQLKYFLILGFLGGLGLGLILA